jgi:2-dehydro-3-deoxyphosphogluconate aldolase / (4S)-4-hydroxy-2-oxoglutarate aldolase
MVGLGGTRVSRPGLPAAVVEGRVVAIARRIDPARLPVVADELLAAGLRVLEVTLDSRDALAAIERLSATGLTVGAGTVLSVREAADAVAAGAAFLVAPHTDVDVVGWADSRGVPALPGALTPTEVMTAWNAGAAAVKIFPASVAGPALIRELQGPLGFVPLVPSGGVTIENARSLLDAGATAVGLGSWLTGCPPEEIASRARALRSAVAGEEQPR